MMLKLYSEVFDTATQQWRCSQANSLQVINGWTTMEPALDWHFKNVTPAELDLARISALLAMDPKRHQLTLGFACQDFPPNVTDPVWDTFKSSEAELAGWRTKTEFLAKATDLTCACSPEAEAALADWLEFLKLLPNHDDLPDHHQRFIYWFEP